MTIALLAAALLVIAGLVYENRSQKRLIGILRRRHDIDVTEMGTLAQDLHAARADAKAERECANKLIAAEQRRVQLLAENRRNADRALGT
jgi:hypothetical protein